MSQQQTHSDEEIRRALRDRPLSNAQKELVGDAIRLVSRIATRLGWRWTSLLSIEDMVQEAHLGVTELSRAYDASKGPFGNFAAHYVIWKVMTAVRKEAKYRHYIVPYCKAYELLARKVDPADRMTDTDETIVANLRSHSDELVAAIHTAAVVELTRATGDWAAIERVAFTRAHEALMAGLPQLPEQQRELVRLHYNEDMTLSDVALRLGVHFSTARRWHQEAMAKLRLTLREGGVEEAPALGAGAGVGDGRMRFGDDGASSGGSSGGSGSGDGKVLPLRRRGRGI